jgi:hypothetical protein
MAARPRHPNKEIEAAVRYAEDMGGPADYPVVTHGVGSSVRTTRGTVARFLFGRLQEIRRLTPWRSGDL